MTIDNSRSRHCTPSAMSGLLDVEVVRNELGATVIFIRGELDRAAVPLLAGCLREVLEVGGSGRMVVLNMAGTDFVDLGGMRLLTDATRWATAREIRLCLTGCSASLLRLLRITELLDEVDLTPPEPA